MKALQTRKGEQTKTDIKSQPRLANASSRNLVEAAEMLEMEIVYCVIRVLYLHGGISELLLTERLFG
jgi:hypothetical protein